MEKDARNPRGLSGSGKGAEVEAVITARVPSEPIEEFVEVVAGDVFHDAAAALHERAGAVDEFGAEEEVARGAVGLAERGIDAGGDRAADGCLRIVGDQERKKLVVLEESGVQLLRPACRRRR